MNYIRNDFLQNGQSVFVNLMATTGKESFYKHLDLRKDQMKMLEQE
ncbi:MAG: hypothetical protein LBC68_08540 [Prevotellaceae bacterium]|jgi:hypothetical protein|nr:hypothetical protein [Prevotellaceae bacterium]